MTEAAEPALEPDLTTTVGSVAGNVAGDGSPIFQEAPAMKVCMPSSAHAGIDHPSYGRIDGRKGVVDLPDNIARDLLRYDGCFPAANKPRGALGFRCTACGFEGYFKTCGRCGAPSERPQEATHAQSQA